MEWSNSAVLKKQLQRRYHRSPRPRKPVSGKPLSRSIMSWLSVSGGQVLRAARRASRPVAHNRGFQRRKMLIFGNNEFCLRRDRAVHKFIVVRIGGDDVKLKG